MVVVRVSVGAVSCSAVVRRRRITPTVADSVVCRSERVAAGRAVREVVLAAEDVARVPSRSAFVVAGVASACFALGGVIKTS